MVSLRPTCASTGRRCPDAPLADPAHRHPPRPGDRHPRRRARPHRGPLTMAALSTATYGVTVTAMADPLTVTCPHCGQEAGKRCASISDWARKPHAARVKAAADNHGTHPPRLPAVGTQGLDRAARLRRGAPGRTRTPPP